MLKSIKSLEQGNVFIELALVVPILILLIAGIVQFGFILNAKVAVNSASYEAARAATLSDKPELDAANAALSYACSTLPGWSFDERLSIKVDVSGTDPGDLVQVNVVYKVPVFFSKISPFSMFKDGYVEICGSSAMSIEEKE